MSDARQRLRQLRGRPYNFLSRGQSTEGAALAFERLDELHRGRRLPTFAELEEVATNPHAIEGFHEWCQRNRRFALWTRETIEGLAAYLRTRDFARVVEVGAGRGDLAWHLERAGVAVLATDLGPDALRGFTVTQHRQVPVDMWESVAEMSWHDALDRLRPDCVLCSWMPPDDDWTPAFRGAAGLREYVLFWELRGTTGGRSSFQRNPGWQPADLVDVERFLVGRTDEGMPHLGLTQYTKATAFRRVDP